MTKFVKQSKEQEVTNKLAGLTSHDLIELTESGNTAIFAALYIARKQCLAKDKKTILKTKVLIPDQAGWFTYKKYPQMLELEPIEVKTDNGIIDLKDLKNKLSKDDVCCFIYQNPAGYFAEQPIKEIHNICKNKCITIMDVSGSIGDNELCNGNYADILVCSFGKWKIINIGYGGFISLNNMDYYNNAIEIFNLTRFDPAFLDFLSKELDVVKNTINTLYKKRDEIMLKFNDFKIIHKKYKGVNITLSYKTKDELNKIIDICRKNKYPYVICPRYHRLKKKAVSIEVKRL